MLNCLGFILDGCSFHYAHIWSKSGIPICWRHLVTSKEWSNLIFIFGKEFFIIRALHVLSYHLILVPGYSLSTLSFFFSSLRFGFYLFILSNYHFFVSFSLSLMLHLTLFFSYFFLFFPLYFSLSLILSWSILSFYLTGY